MIKRLNFISCCVVVFFVMAVTSYAAEEENNQAILTWTKDPGHSQTITWKKKDVGIGYVQYKEAGKGSSSLKQVIAASTVVKAGKDYRYSAVLSGLKKGSTYQYRVGDGRKWSETRTFTTAPKEKAVKDGFSFLYLGDVQHQNSLNDYNLWGKLLQDAYNRNPSSAFGLLGGDMVNSPNSLKQWNLFMQNASPVFSQIPMMTVAGNHETVAEPETYLKIMELPRNGPEGLEEEFYSFDYGNCHFVMLNSGFLMKERQRELGQPAWEEELKKIDKWIEEDLRNSKADWNIAVTHYPLYGMNDSDVVDDRMKVEWEPLFQKGKIDLVLCGHQHVYMRTEEVGGITYVMGNSGQRRSVYYDGENFPDYGVSLDSTNSNYQLIKVTEDQIMLTSYDEKGQIIDRWRKKTDDSGSEKIIGILIGILLLIIAVTFVRIFLLRRGIGARRPY